MAETLYQRPGGIDGIRQLANDAVDAHLANPAVWKSSGQTHLPGRFGYNRADK